MAALLWACTLFILFGMGDVHAQKCTQEYQQTLQQCVHQLSINFNSAPPFSTPITAPLLSMKMVCESPDDRQAFICAMNGLKVCGSLSGLPEDMISILRVIDEPTVNIICGYIPALEQNLPCLNNIPNSSIFRECVAPTVDDMEQCRHKMALYVCSFTEVQTMCPAVFELFREYIGLDPDQSCPMVSCLFEFGLCGGKFRRNMPVEAVQTIMGDFPAISHGINYICGSGKPHVECMMRGGSCRGFNSLMTVPQMFQIQLKPAGYLVNYGCKDINTLTLQLPCLNQQFASQAFQDCFHEILRTVKPNSHPQTQFSMSCSIYQGASNCMNSTIAKQCGQEAVDYFIKWSPATFPLDEGCGSWKFSSASSVEKFTTLMLLQLSIVLSFFFLFFF